MEQDTFAKRVVDFNNKLSREDFSLPDRFRIINPYQEGADTQVKEAINAFYSKYYNDNKARRLILGSSPARRGSVVTGIPFENASFLQDEFGLFFDDFYVAKSSGNFLEEVISRYGGREQFYGDFYMGFVFPLGLVRVSLGGKEVNCNYYEYKKVQDVLRPFIIKNIRNLIDLEIDTSTCFCIGSGENYRFLVEVNRKYDFFGTIIPLEHPRYITQYHSKQRDIFMEKYLKTLGGC